MRKSEGLLWRTKEHGPSQTDQLEECRCVLFSDRRITIERKLGVDASFGLGSTEMVALVQIPTKPSNTPGKGRNRACLQIRTADIIEMSESKQRAMTPENKVSPLLAWQRPIEYAHAFPLTRDERLDVQSVRIASDGHPRQCAPCPRVYFDLNGISQLRTVLDNEPSEGSSHWTRGA